MGKGFGELYKMQGIITYVISPFEQRAFAGAIKNGIPNVFRRTRESIFYIAPPLLLAYFVYDQVNREYARRQRKNPEDYENDQ